MTNAKSNETLAKEQQNKKKQKELVDLECDDEFEEFNEEGIIYNIFKIVTREDLRSLLLSRFFPDLCFARKI